MTLGWVRILGRISTSSREHLSIQRLKLFVRDSVFLRACGNAIATGYLDENGAEAVLDETPCGWEAFEN